MELSQYTVKFSGTLLDASQKITSNRSRCVIAVKGDKALGVISEGDVVRALLRGVDIHSPMESFIHYGMFFLPERDMSRALDLFRFHVISLIPILNEEFELVDVITLQQILEQVTLLEPKEKV